MFAGQMVGHAMGRNMTEATTLAQDLLEQLYNTPIGTVDALAALGTDAVVPATFGGGDYGGGAGGVFIDRNKDGVFNAGVDTEYTQYQRLITIEPGVPAAGVTRVTVTVRWRDDIGAEHSVIVAGIVG
jgi:hypothetical protein